MIATTHRYTISRDTIKGFDIVRLKDEETGTYADIAPSCGAILHAFVVNNNGEETNVIYSYDSAADFKEHTTSKGFRGCKLSPFVCRIKEGKYHFAEKDYKIEKYYDRTNALHGMLYDQPFKVIAEHQNSLRSSVTMIYEYRGSDPGYPFNYDCIVTYELEANNKLNVLTLVVNRDKGLIPIQDGWHPYFTLGDKIDDLQLEFQSKELVEFDDKLIPTGKLTRYEEFGSLKSFGNTEYDNCFTLNFADCQPMCVLRNPGKNIEVEIMPERSYPYLQFYTPPDRNSIAIENISGAPDAFNNGMGFATLPPGESSLFKTSFKITLLS
jgi:aldose 1-epimerase